MMTLRGSRREEGEIGHGLLRSGMMMVVVIVRVLMMLIGMGMDGGGASLNGGRKGVGGMMIRWGEGWDEMGEIVG